MFIVIILKYANFRPYLLFQVNALIRACAAINHIKGNKHDQATILSILFRLDGAHVDLSIYYHV